LGCDWANRAPPVFLGRHYWNREIEHNEAQDLTSGLKELGTKPLNS
jgi:hypothetical protein